MKKALTQRNEQRLSSVTLIQNDSKKKQNFHIGKNSKKILDELARKWVRFGIADTPNEALRMLLEGRNNA